MVREYQHQNQNLKPHTESQIAHALREEDFMHWWRHQGPQAWWNKSDVRDFAWEVWNAAVDNEHETIFDEEAP